jgi:hypothetical protein
MPGNRFRETGMKIPSGRIVVSRTETNGPSQQLMIERCPARFAVGWNIIQESVCKYTIFFEVCQENFKTKIKKTRGMADVADNRQIQLK